MDGTDLDQLSYGEAEGRRRIRDSFAFHERVPALKNAYTVDIPPQLGVRETRRVMGDDVLTEADVLDCASFEDTVGVNGWPIEAHVAGDIVLRWQDVPRVRGFNHLPFRMLMPRGLRNVMVVGRCASMTHLGQWAARASGACFVMGEAAGGAAAMVASGNGPCRDVEVPALQQRLAASGVFPGIEPLR